MSAKTAFENALLNRTAMEHDTPEAMAKYLKEHPDADRSNHTVKKPEAKAEKKEEKSEAKPAAKAEEKSDKPADKPADKPKKPTKTEVKKLYKEYQDSMGAYIKFENEHGTGRDNLTFTKDKEKEYMALRRKSDQARDAWNKAKKESEASPEKKPKKEKPEPKAEKPKSENKPKDKPKAENDDDSDSDEGKKVQPLDKKKDEELFGENGKFFSDGRRPSSADYVKHVKDALISKKLYGWSDESRVKDFMGKFNKLPDSEKNEFAYRLIEEEHLPEELADEFFKAKKKKTAATEFAAAMLTQRVVNRYADLKDFDDKEKEYEDKAEAAAQKKHKEEEKDNTGDPLDPQAKRASRVMSDEEKWNFILWQDDIKQKLLPGKKHIIRIVLSDGSTELATKTEISYGQKKNKTYCTYSFTSDADDFISRVNAALDFDENYYESKENWEDNNAFDHYYDR